MAYQFPETNYTRYQFRPNEFEGYLLDSLTHKLNDLSCATLHSEDRVKLAWEIIAGLELYVQVEGFHEEYNPLHVGLSVLLDKYLERNQS